jgi:hypothetical protein
MTATKCDERIRRNSTNTLPLNSSSGVTNRELMANAKVTYAPLAIWKDFHWTCTVTSFAPPVQDRLE